MTVQQALDRAQARWHLRCADQALAHYERAQDEAAAARYMDLSSRHVGAYERLAAQMGYHI